MGRGGRGIYEGTHDVEELRVYEMILKDMFKKWDGKLWIGLIWVVAGTSNVLL
jgi:hypothetical protein